MRVRSRVAGLAAAALAAAAAATLPAAVPASAAPLVYTSNTVSGAQLGLTNLTPLP